jgi:hypothetical protein
VASATAKISSTGPQASTVRQRSDQRVRRSSVSACTAIDARLMLIPISSTDATPPITPIAGPT